MLKTYRMNKLSLKIAWERLVENKLSSLVYVIGLAVSMIICMLIGLWIHGKISYSVVGHSSDHIMASPQIKPHNKNAITVTSKRIAVLNGLYSIDKNFITTAKV